MSCPSSLACVAGGSTDGYDNGVPVAYGTPSTPLTTTATYGGPDGSRPCESCALAKMGLPAQHLAGDPVNTSNGDFIEKLAGVTIPGLGPHLTFSATYDSKLAQAESASGTGGPGMMGYGWSSNIGMHLSGLGTGGPVTVTEGGGAEVTYDPSPTGPSTGGGTCTSTSGSVQCYQAASPDVSAILIGIPAWGVEVFTRNDGLTDYVFNTKGQLVSISDANGNTESFNYNATNASCTPSALVGCWTATDASGRVMTYAFVYGLLYAVVDPAGRTWIFHYDANSNLASVTNPRGEIESFTYDSASPNPQMVHDLVTITAPNGQSNGPDAGDHTTIAYEEQAGAPAAPLGFVTSVTDPMGRTTSYAYAGVAMGPAGGTTTITDPQGNQTEDTYISGVLMAHTTGVNTSAPATWTYARDPTTLMPIEVVDPNGHATFATYDRSGNLTTSTDALGDMTSYTYNVFNEVTSVTPPAGSSSAVPSQTAGIETLDSYDSKGNLTAVTRHPVPLSGATVTFPDLTTTYAYAGSPPGLPSSVTSPTGGVTSYTYDPNGDVVSTTNPTGDRTTAAYDAIGQPYCTTAPGATKAGVTCPTSPTARVADTTSYLYDSSSMLLSSVTSPIGGVTSYTYDPNGNRTVVQHPEGSATVSVFDADNRTTEVIAGFFTAAQTITTTAYDVAPGGTDCAASVLGATYCTVTTQAAGTGAGALDAVTSRYYNAFGEDIATISPNGTTTHTYDLAGLLTATTTGAGTTGYAYTANNLTSSVTYSGTAAGYSTPSQVTFTYYPDGVRKTMTDSTGTTSYAYDAYGRLELVTDGAGNTTTYGYNANSDVTCLSYPGASATCVSANSGQGLVTYAYNQADQMTAMSDWTSHTTTFAYSPNGQVTTTGYPTTAQTTMTRTYATAGQLTGETTANTNLPGGSQSTAWTENPAGLFATTQQNTAPGATYSYDPLGQVTGLSSAATYSYDQLGQVSSVTPSGAGTTNFGYGTNQALCFSGTGSGTCASPPAGATTYGTNATGARCWSTTGVDPAATCASPPTSPTTTTYAYDQAGNLTCVTTPNTTGASCANQAGADSSTYTYNGDGLRMSATPSGQGTTQFTWDTQGSVPLLLSDGTNDYLYGPGGVPIEQITTATGAASFLVSDPTGLRYQFSAQGTLLGENAYSPYGTCTSCSAPSPFSFADGYRDPTGLLYLINRYYDPSTAQFISVDPLVGVTGQAYTYAGDNPVNAVDPLGLWGWNPISDVAQAVHDVTHHWRGVVQGIAITAAVASLVLTAGADAPALAAAFTVSEGLGSASFAAGLTDFSMTAGSVVLQGYATTAATASLIAGTVGAAGACLPPLGGSFNAGCAWSVATLGLGYGASRIGGLLGSLIGLGGTWPGDPFGPSRASLPGLVSCPGGRP
ncbi:MAG: RHS repeat-associated core domain-containing protein [Acidimicrobiales bacterium]